MPLTDVQVRQAAAGARPRKLFDGDGLSLLIRPDGAKYWRLNCRVNGKHRTFAIGVYLGKNDAGKPRMTLAQARARCAEIRDTLRAGNDPVAARRASVERKRAEITEQLEAARRARDALRDERAAKRAAANGARMTVDVAAERWFETFRPGWGKDHADQVWQSLRDHVLPVIGRRAIADVTSGDILDLLAGMLNAGKIETAARVRQRLAGVWQLAALRGWVVADRVTPVSKEFARLKRGALKARPRRHFPCVAPADVPALLRAMRAYPGDPIVKSATWLLAYTGLRTGELRRATWQEIALDGDEPLWTVPAERMKVRVRGEHAAGDHHVPLSPQAVDVLRGLRAMHSRSRWVFPQARHPERCISENSVLSAIAAMGFDGRHSGHGFRTLLSTIGREIGFASEIVERQLAHEVGTEVARAYDRSELIPERRRLLQAYADHLERLEAGEVGKVLTLARVSSA